MVHYRIILTLSSKYADKGDRIVSRFIAALIIHPFYYFENEISLLLFDCISKPFLCQARRKRKGDGTTVHICICK